MINLALVRKQGITDDAAYKIMSLQQTRYMLHEAMKECSWNKNTLRQFPVLLETIETELQALWGFEQNINYYKFWDVPACVCSKLDNNDNYPHGHYYVNNRCPVHGEN